MFFTAFQTTLQLGQIDFRSHGHRYCLGASIPCFTMAYYTPLPCSFNKWTKIDLNGFKTHLFQPCFAAALLLSLPWPDQTCWCLGGPSGCRSLRPQLIDSSLVDHVILIFIVCFFTVQALLGLVPLAHVKKHNFNAYSCPETTWISKEFLQPYPGGVRL